MKSILAKIDDSEFLDYRDSFTLASKCAELLLSSFPKEQNYARRIVIHVLDNWKKINKGTHDIWADIIETLGFYPYIEKNREYLFLNSFSDIVREKYYLSDFLDQTYFHKEQKKLSEFIMSGKNVIASAPTSFGKSLLIEEVVASIKYKNIVIIQPTLALLDETRLKMLKYNDKYKIIVRTSQSASTEKGNLFLLTAERVMEYDPLPKIDFLIIDEFYKLSLKRKDERADILNNAFLKIINKYHSKFYFLGPNIDNISEGFAEKYNAEFYKSDFSLVDCNIVNFYDKICWETSNKQIDKQKFELLCNLLDNLKDEQTLIYCSTPARARRFSRAYLDHLIENNVLPKISLPLVEWIEKNISPQWSLSKCLQYGIGIHDGSLQKHIATSIIHYFNNKILSYIFCTSTIIEGVNTSAKNVVLFDGKRGEKNIDFFDYSNIKGRSGRLMEHYIGKIYNFSLPPKKEEIIIDIPFFEQNPDIITDEILINIPPNNIKEATFKRYQELNNILPGLLDIIKRNGVSIQGQMNIYLALEKDINTTSYNNIAWTRIPTKDQLFYILGLGENNLYNFESKHGVFSLKQLVRYVNSYRTNKNIMNIVNEIYSGKLADVKQLTDERRSRYYDDAIEVAFHIYRHWFQYKVPKVIRVVDSLQRFVCEQHRKYAGSYSFFVQQLENDFIRENLTILAEFGIPSTTLRLLEEEIPESFNEDQVIQYIKKFRSKLTHGLMEYEVEKLNQCL